jgi:hypothetical protein
MKKNVFIYFLLLIFITGCTKNITDNPVSPSDNSTGKGKSLSKISYLKEVTADHLSPEVPKSLELKRKEFGIKYDPNLPPFKPERVDLSKYPDIVLLTLSEIEKLSPKKGKYFSGHNLLLYDFITFDYYSWCYPLSCGPKPPWGECLGSASSTNYLMDMMMVFSDFYFNWECQDSWLKCGYNTSYTSTGNCVYTNSPSYPNCLWETFGQHYFTRSSNPPYCNFMDYSYAYDGLL